MSNLLVLGGSRFVGRHMAEAAVNAGWCVTVLNNDAGPSRAPAGAEHIFADRLDANGMAYALKGRRWDSVIDTWQGHPDALRTATRLLRDSVALYCLVSSITVYAESARPPITELTECRTSETGGPNDYSARKRFAEMAVLDAFPNRSLILRPGLILGPWEYAGRLPWWLFRVQEGGPILAPGPSNRQLQWVDSRDFASFALLCLSDSIRDVVNVAGPSQDLTMSHLLSMCARVVGVDPQICWIDSGQLLQSGLAPWTEIPLWIPPTVSHASAYDISAAKADQIGICYRPPIQTVEDVWQWMNRLGQERLLRYLDTRDWLDRSRERQLLGTLKNEPAP